MLLFGASVAFLSISQSPAPVGNQVCKTFAFNDMGVEPKIGGKTPKWMVDYNGNPYEQMDDLGG